MSNYMDKINFHLCFYLLWKQKRKKDTWSNYKAVTVALGRGWWFCRGTLKEGLITVRLFSSWPVAPQAPLSVEFSRQEYWSGLPFPSSEPILIPVYQPASIGDIKAHSLSCTLCGFWEIQRVPCPPLNHQQRPSPALARTVLSLPGILLPSPTPKSPILSLSQWPCLFHDATRLEPHRQWPFQTGFFHSQMCVYVCLFVAW